jgi:methylenetetrahydrofolate--tRNA-(uracil-5-)-methyltransferase
LRSGLAAAREGAAVTLYEMKPQHFSPAHHSPNLGELVCSNSLRGAGMNNAVGCLKEELRRCGSLFIAAADATAVPAGGALAVDREAFSAYLTERIENHPRITLVREEMTAIPEGETVIIASGPLTSEALSAGDRPPHRRRAALFLRRHRPHRRSRLDRLCQGLAGLPLRQGRRRLRQLSPLPRGILRLRRCAEGAEKVPARDFEKMVHFEGCMPIEEMAARGDLTLAFGPMKPVGLPDPRTGKEPFAVVQLRQDDRHATLYNMVGFQTKLTYPEQRRLLRTIPGLENARFARLGSVHRNTFVNAPACLGKTLQLRNEPRLFFAGQITGVEGYVESAASGFLAGHFAARWQRGAALPLPPATTAFGALLTHLAESSAENFQPMNVNYGLFPPLEGRHRKRTDRRLAMAERALADLEPWRQMIDQPVP